LLKTLIRLQLMDINRVFEKKQV